MSKGDKARNAIGAFIDDLLSKRALALWNSKEGQALVSCARSHHHRLLAVYFNEWIELIDTKRVMEAPGFQLMIEKEQGPLENPICKRYSRLEKSLRDAEKRLGLTLDGEEQKEKEEEAGPKWGK